MRTLRCSILVPLLVVAAGSGCSRHTVVAPRRMQAVSSSAEPTWGVAAEGLQCRVRPIKRVYGSGESPTFTIDLRNQGGRIFAFRSGGQTPLSQYSIDGHWRRWPTSPPTDGKVRALGPDVEVADMPVILPQDARSLLTPGVHVVRLAFSFEGVEVVSNPVEIEIVGTR
ncbi:MAG: hypothetical protein ABFD90_17065 [Phycisphaerales bacterium]